MIRLNIRLCISQGAKKVLKDTDEIAFARLDVNRFGGPRIVAKKLKDHIEADKVGPVHFGRGIVTSRSLKICAIIVT